MKSHEVKQHFLQHYPHATVQVIDVTGTNNHYKIVISCDDLQKLPRIKAHRSIMSIFDKQFKSGEIHALTIDLKKEKGNYNESRSPIKN